MQEVQGSVAQAAGSRSATIMTSDITPAEREQIEREITAALRRLDGITTTITTAADVNAGCLAAVEHIFDGWYADTPAIDWHDFADRLEADGWTLADMDCPALAKIRRHVARLRDQA